MMEALRTDGENPMRVLIIEDEPRLGRNIAQALKSAAAFVSDICLNGTDGLHMALTSPYDLLVLDLILPDMDGLEILKSLRDRGRRTPVLVLTARNTTEDVVKGLNLGCDDYLTKPFKLDELVARSRALIRRCYDRADPVVAVGDLLIDTAARLITCKGSQQRLPPTEYRLLEYLAMRAGQVVSKQDIVEHLYDFNSDRFSNVIEVYVSMLRKRFGPDVITTVRGQGYVLTGAAR